MLMLDPIEQELVESDGSVTCSSGESLWWCSLVKRSACRGRTGGGVASGLGAGLSRWRAAASPFGLCDLCTAPRYS